MENIDVEKKYINDDLDIPDLDVPLALIKHENGRFSYIKTTNSYLSEINSIGFPDLDSAEIFFNDKGSGNYESLLSCVKLSVNTKSTQVKEFVAKNCFCSFKIRCKYSDNDPSVILCRAWLINISRYKQENDDKNMALRSLYMLYDHINFIDSDNCKFQRLYVNKGTYDFDIAENDFCDYIQKYAEELILPSEKEKFLSYYNKANILNLFEGSKKIFDIEYFRTLNSNGEYVWKAYVLINALSLKKNCFYACVRNVDLTTEHILVKENYIDLFNNFPVAYSIFDVYKEGSKIKDIICIYSSKKMSELMNISVEKMVGSSLFDTVDNKEEWSRIFEKAAFAGENISEIYYLKRSQKWIRITMSQAAQIGRCAVVLEDVTEAKLSKIKLDRDWKTDDLIITCTKYLHSGQPYENAVNQVIKFIGEAINAKRIYIIENNDDGTCSETFEWVKEKKFTVKSRFQNLLKTSLPDWNRLFPGSGSVIIDDADILKHMDKKAYDFLRKFDVHRLIEVPIKDKGKEIGIFGAIDYQNVDAFDAIHLLETLSYFISSELIRKRLLDKLERLSLHDELCNVKNRNAMELIIKKLKGSCVPVGVLYADANGLKKLNDANGHEAGDQLLQLMSNMLSDCFGRENVYRSGGDEFLTIIPDISEEKFIDKCSRIIKMFDERSNISVAAGWSWSSDSSKIEEIMNIADKAMYKNKAEYYIKNDRRKK